MTTNCFAVSRILGERTFTRNLRLLRNILSAHNVYTAQYTMYFRFYNVQTLIKSLQNQKQCGRPTVLEDD